eukprot:TRINITY_DN34857_c0_g1_i1.p1 TRINITY_DN34857_c0_g1~~TRINITY_DN34857_c0_g1_i1.p1  ORF type:complete len:464 (+),score=63.60 TRINITY_DN34857_c0_g1_i1:67-1458(+)
MASSQQMVLVASPLRGDNQRKSEPRQLQPLGRGGGSGKTPQGSSSGSLEKLPSTRGGRKSPSIGSLVVSPVKVPHASTGSGCGAGSWRDVNPAAAGSSKALPMLHPALRKALTACSSPLGEARGQLRSDDALNPPSPQAELVDDSGLDSCCICLEGLLAHNVTAVFPCGHRTHATCAKQWLATTAKPSCPTCRYVLPVPQPAQLTDASSPSRVLPPPTSQGSPLLLRLATSRTDRLHSLPKLSDGLAGLQQFAGDWLLTASPPSAAVREIMEACRCSRLLAEVCLRDARNAGLDGDAGVTKATHAAMARLEISGRELLAALATGDVASATSIVGPGAAGADLSLRSETGGSRRTALMLAVLLRQYSLVQRFCESIAAKTAGPAAQLDVCDGQGLTSLSLAASKGYAELVALLLSYGADASVKSSCGQTAKDLASTDATRKLLHDERSALGSSSRPLAASRRRR